MFLLKNNKNKDLGFSNSKRSKSLTFRVIFIRDLERFDFKTTPNLVSYYS